MRFTTSSAEMMMLLWVRFVCNSSDRKRSIFLKNILKKNTYKIFNIVYLFFLKKVEVENNQFFYFFEK